MCESNSLDRHGGGNGGLAGGSVAEEGNARHSGSDGADDPSVHGGSGGLSHELELGALVVEGDDGDHGVFHNNGLGEVGARAVLIVGSSALSRVFAVAGVVGDGVGEDVGAGLLDVNGAVDGGITKVPVEGVGAGRRFLVVREGGLDGDGEVRAGDHAGRASLVLDNHDAVGGVGGKAGRVQAVVTDGVGASGSHVDHVTGNFDVLGDVTVDHVGAGSAGINVVVVAGSLNVPGAVKVVGALEAGDDRAGLVLVFEGTASGGDLAGFVSAGVLEEVSANVEHVEVVSIGTGVGGLA